VTELRGQTLAPFFIYLSDSREFKVTKTIVSLSQLHTNFERRMYSFFSNQEGCFYLMMSVLQNVVIILVEE
jgi:hypothetical protein